MKDAPGSSTARIDVQVADPHWRAEGRDLPGEIRRAARRALREGPGERSGAVTVLLADDARLQTLNARFRGINRPTNVLSFPAAEGDYLGDVAIAYGVTAREARAAAKSVHDHALHLAVHGVLHLLGYDHETAREARIMEALEIAILVELGIADPYAVPAEARASRRARS